ncbi:MAG: hypothetical protein KAR17_06490, partial [Cyclobacteriaceae bacterium]|nr:hypothetical protein [Cyclobacteriaceae bacterium]
MKFKVSNKSWIVLSTAIVIGIAFSAYFLVYVKGKEKDMVSNNFRVLEQIALNIKSLENSFLKNAESYSFNDQIEIESIRDFENYYSNKKIQVPNAIHYAEADSLYTTEQKKIFYGEHELFFKVEPFLDSI